MAPTAGQGLALSIWEVCGVGDSKGDLSRTAMGQDAILLWGSPCLSFLAKSRRETELWTEFSIPDLISNPTYSVFAVSSAVSFCHFSLEPESQEAGVSPESPGILMEDSVGCQHTGAARGQFQLEKSVSFLSPPPMAPRRPPHTHTHPTLASPFRGPDTGGRGFGHLQKPWFCKDSVTKSAQ